MQIQIDLENPIVCGPLTLFAVYPSGPPAGDYLTGPEAAAQKLFDVSERSDAAAVPELVVNNHANLPLLLVEGEILIGAKQNRTLNVTVLCPAKGETVIPVSCVEAGRWGRAREGSRSRRHSSLSLREVKLRSVSESVLRGFGKTSDQGAVWDAVEAVAARHGVRSPTMDFDEIQEHVGDDVDRLVKDVELRAGQSGVVVGIGGEVRMLELFDKPSTLACYWQSLLSGYATEALGQQEKPTPAAAAKRFGGKVARARSRDAAGAGIGTESHLEAPALTGVALSWNAAPVHLVAFAS